MSATNTTNNWCGLSWCSRESPHEHASVTGRTVEGREAIGTNRDRIAELESQLAESLAREKALREALMKYAHHKPSCDIEDDARKTCTCGLSAALKGVTG